MATRLRLRLGLLVALGVGGTSVAQGAGLPVPREAPRIHGELQTAGDVRVLLLWGDDRERGFAEGYLLGAELRETFESFVLETVIKAPWLWNGVVRRVLATKVSVPPWVKARCEGVIAGMRGRDPALLRVASLGRDLDAEDLAASTVVPDLIGLACSSMVFLPPRSGVAPILARNLDYFASAALLRHAMLIVHAPRPGRRGFVAVGWPGLAGQLTAVADDGLAATLHDVPVRVRPRAGTTPRVVALEDLVAAGPRGGEDRGAALAAHLRGHALGMGGNLMLAWRAAAAAPAGAAVLELDAAPADGGVTLRRPDADASWFACTNHFRARTTPVRCSRYAALADAVPVGGAALTAADAVQVIAVAQVAMTLHQVVVDLGADTLTVRLRRKERAEVWSESGTVSIGAWIARAASAAKDAADARAAGPFAPGR